jgi:hypothetical protein
MALEDLKEQNILLPEEEWGEHRLKTTAAQWPMLLLFMISVVSCGMSYWGDGQTWTWIGIVSFFVSFFAVVLLCDRAIVKQRERFEKEREGMDES